jgi:YHS domain-containing protein
MILGFFRLILFFIIACLVYLFVRFFLAPRSRSQPRRQGRMESGVMVKDEVCNTYLPREDAIRENWQGKEFFFCSSECRRKFLAGRKKDS